MGTIAEDLANFVVDTNYEQIPNDVRVDASWRMVDTVGCAMAGARQDHAGALRRLGEALGGGNGGPSGTAPTFAFGQDLALPIAGFVNGALTHGADFDDTHSVAHTHISSTTVPAALTVGAWNGASGAHALAATIVGAEVGLRLGSVGSHRFLAHGFHPTAVFGPFAATACASALIGNTAEQTTAAFGIAASQATGLLECLVDGSWVKRLHSGWAVQTGITAALLAKQGFTGPPTIFEGRRGLFASLLHREAIDLSGITKGLGDVWHYPDTHFKPYPNGVWNHAATDAVAEILEREHLSASDVEGVSVFLPQPGINAVCEPRAEKLAPDTTYHMKFSLPYSVAMRVVLGHVEVDDFVEEVRTNTEIADLAGRVNCFLDAALPVFGYPVRVIVEARGRSFESFTEVGRGAPQNPMTREDHIAKFRANIGTSIGPDLRDTLLDALIALEEQDDLMGLMHLTSAHG